MVSSQPADQIEKIVQLEEMIAYQANTIDELSHTVSEQWVEIDKLKKQLNALTTRFIDLEEATGPAPENTKPPHY